MMEQKFMCPCGCGLSVCAGDLNEFIQHSNNFLIKLFKFFEKEDPKIVINALVKYMSLMIVNSTKPDEFLQHFVEMMQKCIKECKVCIEDDH